MSTILVNNVIPYTGNTLNVNGVTINNQAVSADTFYGDGSHLTGINPSGLVTISKAELDSLIGSNGLVEGTTYKITGVNTELYGGTDIFMLATSNNTISNSGVGVFYNPGSVSYTHLTLPTKRIV